MNSLLLLWFNILKQLIALRDIIPMHISYFPVNQAPQLSTCHVLGAHSVLLSLGRVNLHYKDLGNLSPLNF